MNREIKFRIWRAPDEYNKTFWMESWDSLLNYSMSDIFQLDNPDDVLEQYTGQKDKNGKEIYEGDIVQFPVLGKPHREIVAWSDIDSAFIVGMMYLSRFQPKMEVLGNVHTNPELLEAQRRL